MKKNLNNLASVLTSKLKEISVSVSTISLFDEVSLVLSDVSTNPPNPNLTSTPEPNTILSLLSLGILGGVSRLKSTKK